MKVSSKFSTLERMLNFCLRRNRFVIILFLLTYLNSPVSSQEIEETDNNDYGECVRDHLKKNADLKDRFGEGMLKEACKRSSKWEKDASDGAGRAADNPILTAPQSAWADKLFKCFDLRCICQLFDLCKNMLSRIDSSLGNMTSGLKEGAEKLGLGGLMPSRRERRRAAVSQVEELLAQRIGKATRKEIRRLTDDERRRFFGALQTLKSERIDSLSKFDIMIVQHTAEYSPGAHFGAAFLPFHREFMKNLEIALRTVDPSTALHYWDPTMDQGLPDPRDSILWTDDFLGNGQGDVTSGPFANWTTVRDRTFRDLSPRRRIVRNIGASPFGSLFKDQDIQRMMTRNRFRDLVYCVDPYFELTHGANHLWIGGHMNELRISPNDPVFFFLHSYVDYLWEEWRQSKQQYMQRLRDYTSDTESCNQFSFAQSIMRPYVLHNVDGLSNQYVEVLYNFESRPACSRARPDCGSPYIFCHTGRSKCLSKIRLGGNCNGLEGMDACLRGQCVNGRCGVVRQTPPPTQAPRPRPPPTQPPIARPAGNNGNSETTPTIIITSRETVWLPVTVLSLNGKVGTPYPKARIVTTERSSAARWTGVVASPSQKPYYTGAAYAQVRSPYGQSSPVRATVTVFDEHGRKCSSMCKEEGVAYNPCEGALVLALDPRLSDGTPFSQNLTLARYLNWEGKKRTPDRLLYLCPVGQSVAAPSASPQGATNPTGANRPSAQNGNAPSGGAIRPQIQPSFAISTNETDKEGNLVIRVDHSENTSNTVTKVGGGSSDMTDAIAAAASASLTPPKPSSDNECRNEHRCCPTWAEVGECKRNEWMIKNCRRSCAVCNANPSKGGCSDLDSKCTAWAAQGQCKSNDVWMEENCQAACKVCNRSADELRGMCGASKNKECVNHKPNCGEWATQWECVNNPWWMKENCPESCNYCKNG